MKWSRVAFAALLLIAAGLWLTGWQPNFDRSIEVSDRFENVENGSAYDSAVIDVGSVKKVVLPHDAVVRREGKPGKMHVFMKKTLSFHGHPSERMSIRYGRDNMGCAVKTDGDDLLLATFGEWDSHIEGGSHMKLVAHIPEGIDVEQRKGLSGEDSASLVRQGQYLTKPKEAKGGYWYGPASPAEGWTAVPDLPDPERTAK